MNDNQNDFENQYDNDYNYNTMLTDEKKEKILQSLHEEIEMQKAKYLLNSKRDNNNNNINNRDNNEIDEIENHIITTEEVGYDQNDPHIAVLSKAKESLSQIENDIQNYGGDNQQYTYQYEQGDNMINENNPSTEFPIYVNNNNNNNNNNQNDYEEEAPKNLEEEISMSLNNNQNDNLITSSSNNNVGNYPLKPSYNFFNPIDSDSRRVVPKSSMGRPPFNKEKKNEVFNKISKQYIPKYKSNKAKSKSKERYEIMKKEIADKFKQDHPFKPTISPSPTVVNAIKKESESERLARLSRPKTIEINERMKQKELNEQKALSKSPFKYNYSNYYSEANHKVNPSEVSNKLFKLHQQMKEKKEKLKREYEDKIIQDYSFAPQINPQSKLLMNKYDNNIDIYERGEIFERAKAENLKLKREALEQEQRAKNKPMISEKSKQLAMRRNNTSYDTGNDVYNRLYRENTKNENENRSYINKELDECTFTPNICSKSVLGPGETYEGDPGNINDFLERQKIYDEIKKDRLNRKISQANSKNEYTFKPKINLTSDILVKTNSLRANENQKDKYDRLYEDYKKIQNRKEQLESFYNAQYDFKPKINELSRFIGRDPTVHNLYQGNKSTDNPQTEDRNNVSTTLNNKSYMNTKGSMSSYIDNECTFQPKLNNNSKYDYVKSNYKNDEAILARINDEVKSKNEKITGLQNVLVKKDVAECKFQPQINKSVPNFESNKPMVMKGMAKYLEQMEKARKAKRDKEEREKEVFITGENWSRDNLITVPKPFKLSYQNIKKKDDIKKQRELQEMKECTFKPKTNESKNREIIKQLLKD